MRHTSLGGAALDPRGDRRRSHLITAGNAHVVPSQRLQAGHFRAKRRRCDVDQLGHRHLSFSLTHLFDLERKEANVFRIPFSWKVQQTAKLFCFFFLQIFTRIWHFVRGEKPSCPGLQLSINLLGCVSVTTTSDTGLGATVKHRKKLQLTFNDGGLLSARTAGNPCGMSDGPTGRLVFTFDVDAGFSGGGDTLVVVSLAAELRVFVHSCKWDVKIVSTASTASRPNESSAYKKGTKNLAGIMKFKLQQLTNTMYVHVIKLLQKPVEKNWIHEVPVPIFQCHLK